MSHSRTRKTQFTQAPSRLVKDKEISLAAKGLFAFMQDKPDGWNFTIKSMASQLKEGENAIRTCLNQLKEFGWVTYIKHHDGTGTYSLNFTPVKTKPNDENPHEENHHLAYQNDENPNDENPHEGFPMMGKSSRIKQTDSLNRQIVKQTDCSSAGEKSPAQPKEKIPAETTQVFDAYREGMKERYGNQIEPARNAKVNSQLKNMISRIGLQESILVARNFPRHQNSWYVQKTHSIDSMLSDCESLLIQVQSGQMVTKTGAYQSDRSGHFQSQVHNTANNPQDQEVF